ncbi:MAG: hypothetical protein ACJATW_001042 [Glaciecola sp.]|jgi:D-alanyl-D-alanine carboxypeptidase
MYLFSAKAMEALGHLSRPSRSPEAPGYSYHGISDFDIGKTGCRERHFTAGFSSTAEYKAIVTLVYVDIRYPTDSLFGARFEPWHIELG